MDLMLQIKIADKIGIRNFDYESGTSFFEPKRYVSLEEQLNNPVFQRDTCYENASELFEYDQQELMIL